MFLPSHPLSASAAITSTVPGPCLLTWLSFIHSVCSKPIGPALHLQTFDYLIYHTLLAWTIQCVQLQAYQRVKRWCAMLTGDGDRRHVCDLVTVNSRV